MAQHCYGQVLLIFHQARISELLEKIDTEIPAAVSILIDPIRRVHKCPYLFLNAVLGPRLVTSPIYEYEIFRWGQMRSRLQSQKTSQLDLSLKTRAKLMVILIEH